MALESIAMTVACLAFLLCQTRPLFVYFRTFHNEKTNAYSTNLTVNDKSIDGALGTRTRGGRTEGADESTELWRHRDGGCLFLLRFLSELNDQSATRRRRGRRLVRDNFHLKISTFCDLFLLSFLCVNI